MRLTTGIAGNPLCCLRVHCPLCRLFLFSYLVFACLFSVCLFSPFFMFVVCVVVFHLLSFIRVLFSFWFCCSYLLFVGFFVLRFRFVSRFCQRCSLCFLHHPARTFVADLSIKLKSGVKAQKRGQGPYHQKRDFDFSDCFRCLMFCFRVSVLLLFSCVCCCCCCCCWCCCCCCGRCCFLFFVISGCLYLKGPVFLNQRGLQEPTT